MEGWLYGLFTLLGVLAGGLFSYLGMKKRLKQQREIDSRQWQRKVRSEPLLTLRAELSNMATRLNTLVTVAQTHQSHSEITKEGENKELQQAIDNWNTYVVSGNFPQTLYLQYDAELLKLVDEIKNIYLLRFEYALDYKQLRANELKEFRELLQKIQTRIPEVQEVINKRLEGL